MTTRLTTAQALVRFLSQQYTERDGVERRLFAGAFGIFGHGNVAGVGQALLQARVQTEDGAEGDDVLGDGADVRAEVDDADRFAQSDETGDELRTYITRAAGDENDLIADFHENDSQRMKQPQP